jgi:hypothetical protein
MSSTKSSNGGTHTAPTTPKRTSRHTYTSSSHKNQNERSFSFNNDMIASSGNYSINDLKINSLQEPTTPIDKLNTPRTVTVPHIFNFPPSPTTQMNENDMISGN